MAEIGAPVWWVGDGLEHGGEETLIGMFYQGVITSSRAPGSLSSADLRVELADGPVSIAGVPHALVGPTDGGVAQVAQPGTFVMVV